MPYTNPTNDWPTVDDVQGYLIAAGLLGSPITAVMATLPWQAFIDSAVERLEELSGISPFKAEALTLQIATEDLANRAAGDWGDPYRAVSLPTALIAATQIQVQEGSWGGSVPPATALRTLTQGTDWQYLQRDHSQRNKPHMALTFHTGCCCSSGVSGVLHITGTWGYSASIRSDIWMLILEYAAALALPTVQSANTLGVATGSPNTGTAAGTGLVEVEVRTEEVTRKFGTLSGTAAVGFATLGTSGTWATSVEARMQALCARLRGPVMA